jgi:hypothetical protein
MADRSSRQKGKVGNRSRSRGKGPGDPNELAYSIVQQATGQAPKVLEIATGQPAGKNPAAVTLGRLGGLRGGKARAAKLTPEQRAKIASDAARARWSKQP